MVFREFWGLADLARTHTFYIYNLLKIIIFNEYKILIFAVFQIMIPNFKYLNNYKKLLVILSIVTSF